MATMETYRHPPESPYTHPHPHPLPQQSHNRHSHPSYPHSHPHHHQRHPSSDPISHHLPYYPPPPPHSDTRDAAWTRSREETAKHGRVENTPPSPRGYHNHQLQSNQQEFPREFSRGEPAPCSPPPQSHLSQLISQPHARRRDEMSSPPLPLPHQYAHAPLAHRALGPTHAEHPQHNSQHLPTQQHQQQQQQQQRPNSQLLEPRNSEPPRAQQNFGYPQEHRAQMQSPPPPRLSQQPQIAPQPHIQQQKQQQPVPQKTRTREQLEQELIQHEKEQKERWQQRKKIQAAQAAEKQRALDEKLRRQEEYLQWDLQRQKQLHQAKTKQLKEEEKQRKAAREKELAQQRLHTSSGQLADAESSSAAKASTAPVSYPSQPPPPRPSSAAAVYSPSYPHHPHYQHYQGPIAKIEPSLKRPREAEGPQPPTTFQQPQHRPQGQYRPPSPREHQSWPRSTSPLSRKGSTVSLSKLSLEEEGGFRPQHQSAASWSEPSSGARGPRMVMGEQHSGYHHSHTQSHPQEEHSYPPRPTQTPHHLSFHHQAQPSPKPRSLQRPQPHSPMGMKSPPPPPIMQQDAKRIRVGDRSRDNWEAAATAPPTPVAAARPDIKRPLSYEYYGSSSLQRSPLLGSRRTARRQSTTATQSCFSPAQTPAPPGFSSRPHSPVGLPPVHPVPMRPLAQPPHPRHYPSPQTPDMSRPPYFGSSGNNSNIDLQPRSQPNEHWIATQPTPTRDRMSHPLGQGQGQGRDRDDREKWEHEEKELELRPPSKEPTVVRGGGGVGSQRPTSFLSGSPSEPGFYSPHQNQQQQQQYHQQERSPYHPSPRHEQYVDHGLSRHEHPQQQQYHQGHTSPYLQHPGHF
ncbi:hypothetical protein EMPS_01731 [Entomortierella parvispora]|uniref:Uncharacterized protein n=1 Tax=Entomortierella parvispora TaxID=205924 RepID=A0A9P3LT87_9FUNG|nr:hypothetical protein EMPS_01731 [Entomortierella parvispora]